MHRLKLIVLLLCSSQAACTDFCNITACQDMPHLGCDNDLTFHSSCLRSRILVNMQMFEDYLVRIHNKYREMVAAGGEFQLPQAAHMPEIKWHPKLALLAEYHVKRCQEHLSGYCLALPEFKDPVANYGLNWLDVHTRLDYHPSSNSLKITLQIDQWMQQIYRLSEHDHRLSEVREIRNILNDRNCFVGCAATEVYDWENSRFVLICYYDEQYNRSVPIYEQGEFHPSNCTKGRSENYAHLCNSFKDVVE